MPTDQLLPCFVFLVYASENQALPAEHPPQKRYNHLQTITWLLESALRFYLPCLFSSIVCCAPLLVLLAGADLDTSDCAGTSAALAATSYLSPPADKLKMLLESLLHELATVSEQH